MKKFYLSLFTAIALLAIGCNPTPDTGGDEPTPTPTPTPDTGATLKEFPLASLKVAPKVTNEKCFEDAKAIIPSE